MKTQIQIRRGAEMINQKTGETRDVIFTKIVWASRDENSGCMLFWQNGQIWYVAESYTILAER